MASNPPAQNNGMSPTKPAAGGVQPCQKPLDPYPVKTGLGANIDKHLHCSPTLTRNIQALQKAGWHIKYGKAGKGSFTDRPKKQIVIDPNETNELDVVQTLAHESGHARYTPDPYVPPAGLTRQQYIDRNVDSALKDEGEATMTNIQVNKETKENCKEDIGVAGAQAKKYQAIADKYPDAKDRDKAREEIGKIFATGETPSTDTKSNYGQYYAKDFAKYWDKNVAPTLKK